MRFAFNNHSINATFKQKLTRAARRFFAHKLAWVGVRLNNVAYELNFDTELDVFMRDHHHS